MNVSASRAVSILVPQLSPPYLCRERVIDTEIVHISLHLSGLDNGRLSRTRSFRSETTKSLSL